MKRAFTLAEVLVLIAVVAVLTTLALAAVARSRSTAIASACASNIRQCLDVVSLYGRDHRDFFPVAFSSKDPDAAFLNAGKKLSRLDASIYWTVPAVSYLTEGPIPTEALCPQRLREITSDGMSDYINHFPEGYIQASNYWLAYGAFTDPLIWSDTWSIKIGGPGFRAMHLSDVVFPAQKGILVEAYSPHIDAALPQSAPRPASMWRESGKSVAFPVGFGDAHVRSIAFADFLPTSKFLSAPFANPPVLCTRAGIRGRDVR